MSDLEIILSSPLFSSLELQQDLRRSLIQNARMLSKLEEYMIAQGTLKPERKTVIIVYEHKPPSQTAAQTT
mgnify:FL=1